MQRTLMACILFLLTALAGWGDTIGIGLIAHFREVPAVTLSSSSLMHIGSSCQPKEFTISRVDKGLCLGYGELAQESDPDVTITPADHAATITISTPGGYSATYRGAITVKLGKTGLTLVNDIDIEDYLQSVVPTEMPAGFNIEALKAQAIAARTYAEANRGKHHKDGFDLCDCTHCQLYGGVDKEKERSTKAVTDTSGTVLTYQGKLISAQYSADCGGTTKSGDVPYLASVPDHPADGSLDYCDRTGHCWIAAWTLADLEKLLQKSIPDLKGLKSVSTSEPDSRGAVDEIKIEADQGSTTITAPKLRNLLGATVVKSTTFTMKVEDRSVIIEGKGFGHGIGLCQFGANGLASPPYSYTYEQILKHYYTGIEIVPLTASQPDR